MSPRYGLNKRLYFLTFIIIFIILLGIVFHSTDIRKSIPIQAILSQNGAPIDDSNISSTNLQSDVGSKSDTDSSNADAALIARIENGDISQDDPDLIKHLRSLILPPSSEPYDIKTDAEDTSIGQAAVINEVFKGKKNGFFIECGALDGETRSNTYFFERSLGWDGILIEGDPSNFKLLIKKHRKVHSVNVCLSVKDKPMKVIFKQNFNIGKIASEYKDSGLKKGYASVQCYPIYSILLALNRTEVDYFSLDVEGVELEVLQTIPFDKLNIKTLSVEYIHDKTGEEGVKGFMEENGYVAYKKVNHPQGLANDIIFLKKYIYDAIEES